MNRTVGTVVLLLGICAVARAQSVDSFNPGADAGVNTLAVQPDGQILVGGAFTTLGGGGNGTTVRNHIGRLAADGSLDASFNPGANGDVNALTVQPDGKILVGGAFTMLGGGGTGTTPRNYLGRLNADGSLDTAFNPGMNGAVYGIALQPDGKILITGGFHMLGGGGTGTTSREFLGRLNSDGSLDTAFNPGMNYFAYAMALQPDGKIVLGGWFSMLGGGGSGTTPRNYIGRINADGSLDASFNPGANNYVNSLAVQPDGRIVVGGSFTALGGGTGTTTRNRLGRLNADGSLDATFNPGANEAVRALTLELDGKVVVVGSFTGLGGGTGTTTRQNLGRLNVDGSLDTSFVPGATTGYWVFGLVTQPDGKILVGGDFVTLSGGPRAHLGRVTTNTGAAIESIDVTNGGSTITWSRSGAGPDVSSVTFESSPDAATYTSLGNGTRVAGGWQLSGLNLPASQNLYIRARGSYGTNGWFSGSGSIVESIRHVYTSCATITLSATAFPNATAGQAYPDTTITQTGGVGVTTFAVTSGELPSGMSLSSAGVVGGTPSAAGTFNWTVTATDSNGCTGSRAYMVTIVPACSSIASTGATFPAAGGPASLAITAPAGCLWTVANVPLWASTISGASGSGSGVWQYTVEANPGPLRRQTASAAGHDFELRQLAGSVVPYGAWIDLAWQPAGDVDYLIDKMVAAGVKNVRMAFRWYMIEPTPGVWSFGVYDDIVTKLRAHGIEILGLLQHPPNWAISGTPGITPPTNDSDWQDYITQVATHFRGQVTNWEIWNEENLFAFWSPAPDAVRYVQLLKIAFNAIRSVDPVATVVLGGLGDNGTFMGFERPEERYYLQKIYDNGGKDYFDVLNVHIYVHPITEGLNGLRTYLQDTHAVMAANGDAGKQLWLTETGWTLTPNPYTPNITETDQANLLTSIFNGRASLGVDRIYWFSFRDLPGDTDEFGMVRRDLTLRPSYYAFQGVMSSPPTVTTQPQSQLISSGLTASLSVAASGAEPYSYQWYVGASGTTTSPIGGATGSSYTTPALTSTTSYWVRISNANGTTSSATATITVGMAPTITTQPQSQTIGLGQTATFNLVAAGTPPLTYQWYVGASGTTTNPIAGATESSYTTQSLETPTSYWVRVSNGFAPAADSSTAAITFGTSPIITAPPQSQRIASGQSVTLNVTATGSVPLTYQWYTGPSGTTTNPIPGATGSSYTTPTLTSTTGYWVRASNAYPPAANSATAMITVGTPASSMVANGTSLTVTTANAVATFKGADLVGFVNSMTNESYLNKPSNGELAQVNAIASNGSLQPSNWTLGTEPGTGLQLATIISSDSSRALTLTVKIDPASQEIVLKSSATATPAGLRGASWTIAGLDLAGGHWIVPGNSGVVFDRDHPGVNAFLQYPYTWQAQMGVYEAGLGSFLIYSTDSHFYSKDLRQSTRGDNALDVAFYTEAIAPFPSATTVPAVEWRLKAFAGGWRAAAQPFRDWMIANRPPLSNAAHPWVANIRTVVGVTGQDASVLAPLAAQVNPSQTLLYMIDWRQASYDVNYPDYTPAVGAANFVATAHSLGFKVMLHTDLIGVAPSNADYAGVQQYQARTPESLQLMGWNWDQPPSTPQRYGLINPAASAFRSLWIARIGAAISSLNPDALHLDFTAMYNDGNGLIEGRTFSQGEDFFNQQIIAAFPNVALGSEEETDFTYRYHSFAQAGLWAFASPGHPIVTFLFNSQILHYGHLSTPTPSDPTFKSALAQQSQRAVFPMWRVNSTADIDTTDVDNARFIGMLQSFQGHDFRPAWTADWTGAAVRYQGLSGSTAALFDSPGLMTLTGAGTQLFQLAHDGNQVTSGSFVNRWTAFDAAKLYGLDPAKLYFLDPGLRPGTTHATSLPLGVKLGSSTLVSTSFARFEVAPASTPFDFIGGLFNGHTGVRFQGADYPLANGAVVAPSSIVAGGVNRSGLFIAPPWAGQVGGETFIEYWLPVPEGALLQFSIGVADNATCTDGVTFRVTIGGTEIWQQNVGRTGWNDVSLPLTSFGGSTVALRLISAPGPANNPNCDFALWNGMALVVPHTLINVPVTLAGGSVPSGFDGDGVLSLASPPTGSVANVPVPGSFTLFTQPGSTATSGTNLAALPFEVWQWGHEGEVAKPGGVFNAGAVGPKTSGGVTKDPTVWAHPPNDGRAMMSWVLRLPAATPLKFGWSAGVLDGASSDDGVEFQVRINGRPYWRLTTGIHGDNHWTAGQLDLSRWQGQSVLVELVSDSRTNYNFDWAAWADLLLSPASVTCAYGVPATASVGASGGSFNVTVTATPTCSWSASSQAPWLSVTSGSGSGDGAVSYLVDLNPGPARSATLTIAGQTVTVNQAGHRVPFTDDVLIAGSTVIRTVHATELRARIDALRTKKGLAAYSWTDPGLASGTAVKALHLVEMRIALTQAYSAAGLPPPTFTTIIGAGVTIRVTDIEELRAAVAALE